MTPREGLPDDVRAASAIERADAHAAKFAGRAVHHPAVVLGGAISELADQPPLILLASATLSAGLLLHRPRLARAGGRMLAAHLLATWLKSLVKARVDRTRPKLLVEDEEYRMEPGDSHAHEENSFPSGHTAGVIAVTRALAREYPQAALPGALAAIAVAAVQVPRGAHYPSDLAAGAALGWVAEAAVDEVARRFPAGEGARRRR